MKVYAAPKPYRTLLKRFRFEAIHFMISIRTVTIADAYCKVSRTTKKCTRRPNCQRHTHKNQKITPTFVLTLKSLQDDVHTLSAGRTLSPPSPGPPSFFFPPPPLFWPSGCLWSSCEVRGVRCFARQLMKSFAYTHQGEPGPTITLTTFHSTDLSPLPVVYTMHFIEDFLYSRYRTQNNVYNLVKPRYKALIQYYECTPCVNVCIDDLVVLKIK